MEHKMGNLTPQNICLKPIFLAFRALSGKLKVKMLLKFFVLFN